MVNLALQGGGAHGAFAWGVLDKLLEDGRVDIEGLSAASAGAMNASVYAFGKMTGGTDGARQALHDFWSRISAAGSLYSPAKRMPWEFWSMGGNSDNSLGYWLFDSVTRMFSPYQLNPFDINPLRDVLTASVDFEKLVMCQCTNLFISATNVRTGKVRVFKNEEMSLDVVMASACLPYLFKAVEIGGEHYWDGGYMGNPALFPLFYHTGSKDVIILHLNPIHRADIPKTSVDIADRINEISFNSSLLKELRAVAFVNKLIDEDWVKEEYRARLKHVLVHSIRADMALSDLNVSSKFNCDWDFLTSLRDKGRETAAEWLDKNYQHLGKQSTVDLRAEYLGLHSGGIVDEHHQKSQPNPTNGRKAKTRSAPASEIKPTIRAIS